MKNPQKTLESNSPATTEKQESYDANIQQKNKASLYYKISQQHLKKRLLLPPIKQVGQSKRFLLVHLNPMIFPTTDLNNQNTKRRQILNHEMPAR